jgi:hypothetical protein
VPRLACWSCGRQIYTVSPLNSLSGEERRCPRCGAFLNPERRELDRRERNRRQNPPDDPGPPGGVERRKGERRRARRRKPADGTAG